MANKDHIDMLREGSDVWNEWRRSIELDLPSEQRFQPDLVGADLAGAFLMDSNLAGADLTGANLHRVGLNDAYLVDAILVGADLTHASLDGAVLKGADLTDADLTSARLNYGHLLGANLSRTRLCGARIEFADLSSADLTDADLADASLEDSDLSHVKLDGANLSGVALLETLLINVDLSTTKGLDACRHYGRSTLDFRTLGRSGPLPEVFLRGCGLPDNLIEYLPSLLNEPIQFYSCFISFTEADDELSQRLYNDLQGAGVRCWRWKEDAKWGRSLMGEIDQAVHIHDKLVVLCSEDSLKSMPVIREIERALQREDNLYRQGEEPEVLFPIRLDGYIFDEWNHPRKADVIAKTVGDFTEWKDHDKYQTSFDRLLKSLKPDPARP